LVLTPNTYLLNAATSFNGNLYLNALGNSNAVFVIQINGALSTSTFSRVVLMNGANANNIFWKVDRAASINDYSVFHGTLIVNNGALNLATGDSIYGRAFTTTGALSTAAMTILSPRVTCTTLPATWLYFRANKVASNVELEWSTTAEVNHSFFTLEKSSNGVNFKTIATIDENTPNGSVKHVYSFTDLQPFSIAYYRIGQTDKDGTHSYYKTISVRMDGRDVFSANQFVQGSNILIQTSGAEPARGTIRLYNAQGIQVVTQPVMLNKEMNTYLIKTPNQKGIYFVNILSQGKIIYTSKVMVL
jgi:hypothetical protein